MVDRYETSIRCIPFPDQIPEAARGEGTGASSRASPAPQRVIMAKAY